MPTKLNILLLGHTGVGKSTFINSIANYLTYESFEEALNNEPVVLLPMKCTMATIVDSEITPMDILMLPTNDSYVHDREQLESSGDSATQRPSIYEFRHGKQIINIVDVPGIADTRGLDKDTQNIQKILDLVGSLGQLHLICIMLKSNESRLTAEYTYGLNELLMNLHKKAISNIIFVFTNTRGTDFMPGEGLSTLKQYTAKIVNKGITINLNKDTVYCVDSEVFRVQCFQKTYPNEINERDYTNYSECWTKSSSSVKRIFNRAKHLDKAYETINTMSINEARCAILFLMEPLTMVSSVLISCKANMTFQTICNQLIDGRIVGKDLEIIRHAEFNTVCESPKCSGKNQVCHKNCQLLEIGITVDKDPRLKDCAAFDNDDESNPTCYECGCKFEYHKRTLYAVKIEDAEYTANFIKEVFTNYRDGKIKETEATRKIIDELQLEHDEIVEALLIFGKFLKDNAILTYNNAYEDKLRLQIRMAEQENEPALAAELRSSLCKFTEERDRLEDCMKDGEKKKSFLSGLSKKIGNKLLFSKKKEITPENIQEISNKLLKLKLFGGKIKELYDMQIRMAEKDLKQYTVSFETKLEFPK